MLPGTHPSHLCALSGSHRSSLHRRQRRDTSQIHQSRYGRIQGRPPDDEGLQGCALAAPVQELRGGHRGASLPAGCRGLPDGVAGVCTQACGRGRFAHQNAHRQGVQSGHGKYRQRPARMAQPRAGKQDRGGRQLPASHRARTEAGERPRAAYWHGVPQPVHYQLRLPAHPAVSDPEGLLLLRDAGGNGKPRLARSEEAGQPRHPLHPRGEEGELPQRHQLPRAPHG